MIRNHLQRQALFLDDVANARLMAERFREQCHRQGTPEAYRRKRQHIRAFLAWCIVTSRAQFDPFAAVLPSWRAWFMPVSGEWAAAAVASKPACWLELKSATRSH